MKKIQGNLIIEVTRRCNTSCDHCLRGESENKIVSYTAMKDVILQYSYIDCITFTGGEPSLNPEAIDEFINICKYNGIAVGSFYIATNGKVASDKFMLSMMKLYNYCDNFEDGISSLSISNDQFHSCNSDTVEKLKVFSFTRMKGEITHPISEGYYADYYGDGRENIEESLEYLNFDESYLNVNDVYVYLNCDGNVVLGCDWSYKNQDEHILCSSSDCIYESLKNRMVIV